MNRRTFLKDLIKGVVIAGAAPQIITHGLKLQKRIVPVHLYGQDNPYGFNSFIFPVIRNVYPREQFIKDFMTVQPMSLSKDLVFHLEYAKKPLNKSFYKRVTIGTS